MTTALARLAIPMKQKHLCSPVKPSLYNLPIKQTMLRVQQPSSTALRKPRSCSCKGRRRQGPRSANSPVHQETPLRNFLYENADRPSKALSSNASSATALVLFFKFASLASETPSVNLTSSPKHLCKLGFCHTSPSFTEDCATMSPRRSGLSL